MRHFISWIQIFVALVFLLELSGEIELNKKEQGKGKIEDVSQLPGTKNEILAPRNEEMHHTCTTESILPSFLNAIKSETLLSRTRRATSQFEQFCSGIGSQPCTCNHPDHPNVTHFEIENDPVTYRTLHSEKAPTSCEDMKEFGHSLNGYYLVKLNTRRVHAIYCELNSSSTHIKDEIATTIEQTSIKSLKPPRFCANLNNSCSFFYSDYPDAPKNEMRNGENSKDPSFENDKGPTSCEDLKFMGYKLNGFYMVRFNVKRMKAVFCDFTEMGEISQNDQTKTKREVVKRKSNTSPGIISKRAVVKPDNKTSARKVPPFCNGVGSQPCSCHLKYEPTIPQFELGADEITRNAASKNGKGPENCEDLKSWGHTLNGFYLVRLDSMIVRIVYCNYNPLITLKQKSSTKKPSTKLTTKSNLRKEINMKKDPKTTDKSGKLNKKLTPSKSTTRSITAKKKTTRVTTPSSTQSTAETSIRPTPKNEKCKCKRAARLFPIRKKDENTCQCQDPKNEETTTAKTSTTTSTQIPVQTSKKITTTSPTTAKTSTTPSTQIPVQTSTKLTTTSSKTKTKITQLTKKTVFTTEKPKTKGKESSTLKSTSKSSGRSRSGKPTTKKKIVQSTVRNEEKKTAATLQVTVTTSKITKSTKGTSTVSTTPVSYQDSFQENSPLLNDGNKKETKGKVKTTTKSFQPLEGKVKYSSTALTKIPSGKSSPSKNNKNEGENKEKTKSTTAKSIVYAAVKKTHAAETPRGSQDKSGGIIFYPSFIVQHFFIDKNMDETMTQDLRLRKNEEKSPSSTNVKAKSKTNINGYSQIKNENGMCLAVMTTKTKKSKENGAKIIQAKCDPSKKGQNWKWENLGTPNRLCNAWDNCLHNEKISKKNNNIQHFQRINCFRQHWYQNGNPGVIKNLDICLAVENDSNVHGAAIITTDCNPKENGQRWTFGPA